MSRESLAPSHPLPAAAGPGVWPLKWPQREAVLEAQHDRLEALLDDLVHRHCLAEEERTALELLADRHDCLLLDLDGTVFRGHAPTPGALGVLEHIGSRALFVTNNASRSAEEVAHHLRELGFIAAADDVVTSAQSAARMLAARLPAAARVLVVGTDALAAEIAAVGLVPVRSFADEPTAVVQGLSMTIGWPELAEATLAIRAGALWVTANLDTTLPTERGLVPGNGSMVAALRAATAAEPLVAGKPAPALMQDALAREAAALADRFPDPARRPPLFGVAVGVKDIFHVDGLPTRAGSLSGYSSLTI